ncbi:hypothetical protein [Mucilaginibacter jinjuensis]|uniref:Uncharacterized protein n=1 Tax=Mucilaginibacter jinjuensis TaxID=1176721 RepID=A0ABY7TFP7_9SPHI|nr:hypothetical protein [Mucilaginibacter jinjuensis]WCT14901.1 hypothetical protein PQO05_13240 [Mucilaginibacter jinjuensis]
MKHISIHFKYYCFTLLFSVMTFLGACTKTQVKSETVVYSNDFESGDVKNIANGAITVFNGTHVLGRYNSNGFALTVANLPKHDLVEVTFDLYIHDTWDGNNIDNGYSGPDLWSFLVDGSSYIHTSFSNADCPAGVFCTPQAYPNNYPNNNNNPKAGAYNTNLPGACYWASKPNGTTEYKISKQINHTDNTLLMQCIGDLVQKNVADPMCDESWSVDNIVIKAIAL